LGLCLFWGNAIPTAKLSRRLFVLTTLALAPAAVILFYNVASTRIDKQRELHAEALRSGQLAGLELSRIVTGLENVLMAVSSAPVVQRLDAPECSAFLTRVSRNMPEFSGLSVVNTDGIIICRNEAKGIGTSLKDRPYFQEAMASGRFVLGGFTKGRVSGAQVLPLAVPTRDDEGKIRGVVIGALDLKWLGQRLRDRDFPGQNALTIADRDGVILAREPKPEAFVGTKIPDAFQHLVHAEKPGTIEVTSQDGTRRVIGYKPVTVAPMGLYLSAGISTADAYEAIDRTTIVSLIITLLGLSVAYLVAWLSSQQLIHQPVGRLATTIGAWRAGDVGARTGMNAKAGEFSLVGQAIDEFMDELISSRAERRKAEQQRELLVSELDHRVKNILAMVQAVARQTFRSKELTADTVQSFDQRLQAMSEAHGLLMKDEWQAAKMGELVATTIAPFNRLGRSAFSLSGPDIVVPAKAALAFSMAVHEMCTNAAKYGALSTTDGHVTINWQVTVPSNGVNPLFEFRWIEHGGPPVQTPQRLGFGSKMIERALSSELGATVTIEYAATGVVCTVKGPFDPFSRAD
jgi:two-component sensor histidine kinase